MEIIKKIEDWLLLMYSYILPIQKRLFIMLLGEERYSSLTFRNIKKLAWILCYYIVPAIVGALIFLINTTDFALLVGTRTMNIFMVILLVSPLSRLFPRIKLFRYIMWLRRELWVLIFWFVIRHSLFFMIDHNVLSRTRLVQVRYRDDYYARWFLATAWMIVLGITSNTKSLLLLKRGWKNYIILCIQWWCFLLSIQHLLATNEQNIWY